MLCYVSSFYIHENYSIWNFRGRNSCWCRASAILQVMHFYSLISLEKYYIDTFDGDSETAVEALELIIVLDTLKDNVKLSSLNHLYFCSWYTPEILCHRVNKWIFFILYQASIQWWKKIIALKNFWRQFFTFQTWEIALFMLFCDIENFAKQANSQQHNEIMCRISYRNRCLFPYVMFFTSCRRH